MGLWRSGCKFSTYDTDGVLFSVRALHSLKTWGKKSSFRPCLWSIDRWSNGMTFSAVSLPWRPPDVSWLYVLVWVEWLCTLLPATLPPGEENWMACCCGCCCCGTGPPDPPEVVRVVVVVVFWTIREAMRLLPSLICPVNLFISSSMRRISSANCPPEPP